jgi:hypothetical protein
MERFFSLGRFFLSEPFCWGFGGFDSSSPGAPVRDDPPVPLVDDGKRVKLPVAIESPDRALGNKVEAEARAGRWTPRPADARLTPNT